MNAWLEILRPANCGMAAIAVLVGMLLVVTKLGASFSLPVVLLAAVAAFLIAGAGNAINDYVDVEADKVNRPKRPIPSGRVSRAAALNYSIALFAIGIFLAAAIFHYTGLWWPAAIAAVNSGLLILYAFRLKDSLLIGNIVVSYLVGSSFLFGGAAAGDLLLPLLLTLLAALANLGREVAKTLEDLEGDRVGFLRKLARKAKAAVSRFKGEEHAELRVNHKLLAGVGALSLVLAVVVSPAPFVLRQLGLSYLAVVGLADLAFLAAAVQLLRARTSRGYHSASKTVKLGMLLGLVAFIVGVLV